MQAPAQRRDATNIPRRIDVSSATPLTVTFLVSRTAEVIAKYKVTGRFPLMWPVPNRDRMVDITVDVVNDGVDAQEVIVNDLHNVTENVLLASAFEVQRLMEQRSTISPLQERKR
jgi:hypothetical protein